MVVANPLRARPASPPLRTTCWRTGFWWSAFSDAAHTNKSPAGRGGGASWSVAIQGLPIPPETQARPPPTPSRTVGFAQKPRQGAGLSLVQDCLDGACRPRGQTIQRPLATPTPSRRVGCTQRRGRRSDKSPAKVAGLRSRFEGAWPVCDKRQTHRDNTTVGAQRAGIALRTAARQGSSRSAARRFGFLPSSVLRLAYVAHGIRPERRRH